MIFVDSNVPMYLVGAAHPNTVIAQQWLEGALRERTPLVTDAEALQEIMHRYVAIHRPDAIVPATDILLQLVDEVLPITREHGQPHTCVDSVSTAATIGRNRHAGLP